MARKRGRVTPELTRWFGRDGDMALLRALLAEDRKLVTLTGPGGVGKTRLAKELLFAVHDTYDPEATAFVELDQVAAADQDDINEQVVAALDINFHESDQDRTRFDVLVEKLHGRKGLLVLDNCEHLSDAAGEFVAALVEDVPSAVRTAAGPR